MRAEIGSSAFTEYLRRPNNGVPVPDTTQGQCLAEVELAIGAGTISAPADQEVFCEVALCVRRIGFSNANEADNQPPRVDKVIGRCLQLCGKP